MKGHEKEIRLLVVTEYDAPYFTTMDIFEKYNRAFIVWRHENGHHRAVSYRVKRKDIAKIIKKVNKKWTIGNVEVTYDSKEDGVRFLIGF